MVRIGSPRMPGTDVLTLRRSDSVKRRLPPWTAVSCPSPTRTAHVGHPHAAGHASSNATGAQHRRRRRRCGSRRLAARSGRPSPQERTVVLLRDKPRDRTLCCRVRPRPRFRRRTSRDGCRRSRLPLARGEPPFRRGEGTACRLRWRPPAAWLMVPTPRRCLRGRPFSPWSTKLVSGGVADHFRRRWPTGAGVLGRRARYRSRTPRRAHRSRGAALPPGSDRLRSSASVAGAETRGRPGPARQRDL